MKKLLKKITMILCSFMIIAGFVGNSISEADAATKYYIDKNYTVKTTVGANIADGVLTVKCNNDTLKFDVKGGKLIFKSKSKNKIRLKAEKSTDKAVMSFSFQSKGNIQSLFVNEGNGVVKGNTLTFTAKQLKNKNGFKVKIQKNKKTKKIELIAKEYTF